MTQIRLRRSFNNGFVFFVLFSSYGCGKGDRPAGGSAPQPREAIPEAAITLPEYYGLYAIELGKAPNGLHKRHAPRDKEESLCEFTDPGGVPLVGAKAEFILFDRKVALGVEAPRVLCCNNDHSIRFVESRTKPVNAKPEMLRIVPMSDLSPGLCGLRSEGGLRTEVGTYYLVEVGDVSSVVKRVEEFRKPSAVGRLEGLLDACNVYAKKNAGMFPPSLEALLTTGDIIERELESPNDPRPLPKNSYLYVAGQTDKSDGRNVLVYELPEFTVIRIPNVAFVDGRVEYLDPEALKTVLAETKQRLVH